MGKIAHLQEIPTADLVPYQANAKMHGKKQIEQLKQSINEFGFLTPCLIDADNNIIAGHGRIMAAQELGMETVPCVCIEELTEEQRRAYILADNRLTELGEWDRGILSAELAALQDAGFNIELTGFNIDDIIIDDIDFSEIDDAWNEGTENEGTEAEPITRRGDLFQLGRHRLLCGDATSRADVERLTGDNRVQLVITDPPYNVDYSGHRKEREKIQNDNKSDAAFFNFLSAAFENFNHYLDAGRSFYIFHADMEREAFLNALKSNEMQVRQILVWVKNSFVISRQDYNWRHEPIIYGWAEGAPHYFCDDHGQSNVAHKKPDFDSMTAEELRAMLKKIYNYSTAIYEDRPVASDEHPTMKPINLLKRLIENSSRPKERVLDIFGGSGSTLIAAEQTGRDALLLEIQPKYVDAIIKRWETYTGQKAVLIETAEDGET